MTKPPKNIDEKIKNIIAESLIYVFKEVIAEGEIKVRERLKELCDGIFLS